MGKLDSLDRDIPAVQRVLADAVFVWRRQLLISTNVRSARQYERTLVRSERAVAGAIVHVGTLYAGWDEKQPQLAALRKLRADIATERRDFNQHNDFYLTRRRPGRPWSHVLLAHAELRKLRIPLLNRKELLEALGFFERMPEFGD